MIGLALAALGLFGAPETHAIVEPSTGLVFPANVEEMSLLGVGVRTKTFLKLKVYALALYVADSALSGPLADHRGRGPSAALYRELVHGDFEKQLVLKLVRNLSAQQIRGTFRSHMPSADKVLLAQFVSYFSATAAGQDCTLRWVPGSGLHTTLSGESKPPIRDKAFADAVFAIWLRERAAEDPIRKQLVSRVADLLP
jgi:hypothetical protein